MSFGGISERVKKDLHQSPGPNPERAIYGLALLLFAIFSAVVYLIWAFLPPKYLIAAGIDFLPHQYWAIAVPVCFCSLLILIPLIYGLACLRFIPEGGLEHLATDSFSRTGEYYRVLETPENGIPPLCDIPLDLLPDPLDEMLICSGLPYEKSKQS